MALLKYRWIHLICNDIQGLVPAILEARAGALAPPPQFVLGVTPVELNGVELWVELRKKETRVPKL
jgi:hypothetical protein